MVFPRYPKMRLMSDFVQSDELPNRSNDENIELGLQPVIHPKVDLDSNWTATKSVSLLLFALFSLVIVNTSIALLRTYALLVHVGQDHAALMVDPMAYKVAYPHFPVLETSRGDEAFWCDRSDNRTDVCFMRGDVHLIPGHSTSLVLYSTGDMLWHRDEVIWPYARKWDDSTLRNVEPVLLRNKLVESGKPFEQLSSTSCKIVHQSPLLLFSTGGYTGNPYHDFNDVIIPLFINSRHFGGNIVFGITDVRDWWIERFSDLFGLLSKHSILNINSTEMIHCFPEATVGLRVHADLAVDPSRMPNNETIKDFQQLLHHAFALPERLVENNGLSASIAGLNKCIEAHLKESNKSGGCRPKLVIITRKGSRQILNVHEVARVATEDGFDVEVLEPSVETGLRALYRSLQEADVTIGVHGAALTHILFMRPRSVFIQIVPLGTDWPARTYYQEPAENQLDLQYIEYKINPNESTLIRTYGMDDVVIKDPEAIAANSWDIRKKMYLEGQNVRLSIPRIRETFGKAKRLAQEAFQ